LKKKYALFQGYFWFLLVFFCYFLVDLHNIIKKKLLMSATQASACDGSCSIRVACADSSDYQVVLGAVYYSLFNGITRACGKSTVGLRHVFFLFFFFLSDPNLEIKDITSKNKLYPQVCISINIIIRAKLILSCYLFIILLIVFYFIIFLIYLFFNFIHDHFIAFIFSI